MMERTIFSDRIPEHGHKKNPLSTKAGAAYNKAIQAACFTGDLNFLRKFHRIFQLVS